MTPLLKITSLFLALALSGLNPLGAMEEASDTQTKERTPLQEVREAVENVDNANFDRFCLTMGGCHPSQGSRNINRDGTKESQKFDLLLGGTSKDQLVFFSSVTTKLPFSTFKEKHSFFLQVAYFYDWAARYYEEQNYLQRAAENYEKSWNTFGRVKSHEVMKDFFDNIFPYYRDLIMNGRNEKKGLESELEGLSVEDSIPLSFDSHLVEGIFQPLSEKLKQIGDKLGTLPQQVRSLPRTTLEALRASDEDPKADFSSFKVSLIEGQRFDHVLQVLLPYFSTISSKMNPSQLADQIMYMNTKMGEVLGSTGSSEDLSKAVKSEQDPQKLRSLLEQKTIHEMGYFIAFNNPLWNFKYFSEKETLKTLVCDLPPLPNIQGQANYWYFLNGLAGVLEKNKNGTLPQMISPLLRNSFLAHCSLISASKEIGIFSTETSPPWKKIEQSQKTILEINKYTAQWKILVSRLKDPEEKAFEHTFLASYLEKKKEFEEVIDKATLREIE